MARQPTTSPLDDIAYLTRSEHRVQALVAMAVRPRSRSELWELTGVSSSTLRRTLRDFENRRWIERDGYQYEATQLGQLVATAMTDVLERFETEHELRDIWEWLPGNGYDFKLSMCADATIAVADADDPYRPVTRFIDLVERSETFRFVGFDIAILEPCKEQFTRAIVDGMEAEIINPPRVVRYVRSSYPDLFAEALDSGNLTVRLHDDLPSFGVCLVDDRVAISGYDPDSVTVRALVDTDGEAAREWAEDIYARYRRQTPTISLDTA